jgi:hypothetical protein
MSIPINQCLITKAARGDEQAYEILRARLATNVECGHFTIFPCNHIPACEATQEELDKLQKRIDEDIGV